MSIFLLLLYLLLGLLSYLAVKQWRRFNYWQSRGIPVEQPNFIVGNIKGVRTKRHMGDVWLSYYKKFKGTGPFAGFYMFQQPSAFILDTALIKNILIKDFNKFSDRGMYYNEKDDPLSGQLFMLDGQKWKTMRNKLSPTFTSGKMKHMFPTVIKVGHEFVQVFAETVKQHSIVEVKDLCARYTTDVIGTCAFGIECNSLKDPNNEFRAMCKKSLEDQPIFTMAFASAFPNFSRKIHLKINPKYITDFFMRIVRETVALREANSIRRNDFMDQLIDLKNNKLVKAEHGDDLTNLTMGQITAQAFIFFNAGFETSSSTMSFALYELAQNVNVQQKAREEVAAVLNKHNQELTYESMKELQYLDQIISETLRLYTILPVINRYCLEDYVVPGHPNYVIEKGMPVWIPANAIHRDSDYYPNPDVFNPDNFSPEMVEKRDSVEWLPFGDGPRNCIGMRFGQMQTRVGLAMLLKEFKFSVCSETPIPMVYDKNQFLISSEKGIYLKVEKL